VLSLYVQGAAEKSGPLIFFAVFSAAVLDFNMKFYSFFNEIFYIYLPSKIGFR